MVRLILIMTILGPSNKPLTSKKTWAALWYPTSEIQVQYSSNKTINITTKSFMEVPLISMPPLTFNLDLSSTIKYNSKLVTQFRIIIKD